MAMFQDRIDAGRRLAEALQRFATESPVILALPRGGVPVGFEVAQALRAPLDVVLVRKVGVPGHEELALGAIVDGDEPQFVLNEDVAAITAASPDWLEEAKREKLKEIERRRALYRSGRPPEPLAGKTAIVVDDGIATGATTRAALRGVRRQKPKRLVLAVPVAPPDTLRTLATECDEIVCLEQPTGFGAVGMFFADFRQTSDDDVVRLLVEANAQRGSASDAGAEVR